MGTHSGIQTTDRKMILEADSIERDVLLVLSGNGLTLRLKLSSLMRSSLQRPWNYRPLDLVQSSHDVLGGVMIVSGKSATFEVSARFSFKGNGLHCQCAWDALQDMNDAGVAFVIDHEMTGEKATLPMSIYNDNPAIDPGKVAPHFGRTEGASFVAEESRYPIPCVNVEWKEKDASRYVSLFAMPEPGPTQWSLGVHRPQDTVVELMAASGSVSFNGRKDENYGCKNAAIRVESGYRELRKGQAIARSFVLRFDTPSHEGHGFRDIVRTGFELLKPKSSPALSLDEVVSLKTQALNERWYDDGSVAGFLCVAEDNIYRRPPYFLWGWTGQSFKMAYCSAREGFESGRRELVERARKCVQFFLKGSRTRTIGLHYNRYLLEKAQWVGEEYFKENRFSSRALGETFWNFSKLILLFQQRNEPVSQAWITALSDAADFLIEPTHLLRQGIPPYMWFDDGRPTSDDVSSAGSACICAILGAYKVMRDKKYLLAAEKMLAVYWKTGADKFDTPFSKATLDSGCEDKEAAVPFFIAAADLYYLTGEQQYKHWANVSGDWLLTWVYFWEVQFKEDSICAKYGFKSTGWPTVSVENQHLDVFFPAFEMFEYGKRTGDVLFKTMGRIIFEAFSHGISKGQGDWFFDKPGRQGEQYFQTRWGFSPALANYPEKFKEHFRMFGYTGDKLDTKAWEGGYNPWDTSWIIVMVLEAAQNMKYGSINIR